MELKAKKKNNGGQKQTIRKKLMVTSMLNISIAMLIVGVLAVLLNIFSTFSSLKQTMSEAVEIAAGSVSKELEGYRNLAQEIASKEVFVNGGKSVEKLKEVSEEIKERYGFVEVGITNADGIRILTEEQGSVVDRDYFQKPKSTGQPYVSDPVLRTDDGTMNIFITAPILKDKSFNGIVYMAVDANFLCEMVSSISVGQSGNAAILNSKGDTIGFADVQLVIDAYNTQAEAKSDSKLKRLAEIEANMCAGKSGFEGYYYGGLNKFMAYTPIEGTNGWSIDIAISRDEFMRTSILSAIVIGLLTLAAVIISVILMRGLSNGISVPIIKCVERIEKLAKGDLQSEVPQIDSNDETGILAKATEEIVQGMNNMIGDVDYLLGAMSEGDFSVESKASDQYAGDFKGILVSIGKIKASMIETLSGIKEAASQVSSGSSQMAESAADLAEGATDQAGSVEELRATIMDVADQVKRDSEETSTAHVGIRQVGEIAQKSRNEMEEMKAAMERINNTSRKIGDIIASIEEIASQTNLLSLNASIEAARAGEMGKGFAVVAGEIGKLAGESAQAAVDTRELIESSVREVEAGNQITEKTADSLKSVVENLESVVSSIENINEASQRQSNAMQQIDMGIEQISGVVQNTSATAEETSATSEELSAQAEMLDQLVKRFRLD